MAERTTQAKFLVDIILENGRKFKVALSDCQSVAWVNSNSSMPRRRSRSRSRSRTPKRMARHRRSRSRSSSGSPHYEKKRKPARRYSKGSLSPRPRQYSRDGSRDGKLGRRSLSSSPERSRRKNRSPKRPYSRSRSVTPQKSTKPPANQFDSSAIGSSSLNDFEVRIRELQGGTVSKFPQFGEEGSGRQVKIHKDEKPPDGLEPPGGYGPNQSSKFPGSPPRDRLETAGTDNFSGSYQRQNYPTESNGRKDRQSSRQRSPSPPRRRNKSRTPPTKHRKSKYRSESPPPRKRSKDSSKKSRRAAAGESDRKKSPPRSSRLGPGIESHLIAIPRRKDEGTTPIFDRPEIPVYTIRDDPSLIAEGYFDKEDSQRARNLQSQPARSYAQVPRDTQRAPSPTVTFRSTGLEKLTFPNSAAFFERRKEQRPPSAQIVSTTLGEIHDRMRSSIQATGLHVDHLPNTDLRLALERKQLSPLRAPPFGDSDLLRQETMLYEREKMGRSLSEERRPVKERLGGKKDDGLPDFKKEVDMLNQSDPLLTPKSGYFYEHDNRDNDGHGRPPYTSPMRRPFRGRGGYRGNRYIRGFRGRFNRGFSYSRPGYQGYQNRDRDRWTHDKFEDERKSGYKKDKHGDSHADDKSSKKEKKAKKSDRERRSSHHKS